MSSSAPSLTSSQRHLQNLLASGAYHLPGNNWWKDWLQYFGNNHPLFSPCFQHPLHPISKWLRAVGIFGSIMVGLVITNIMYLLFIHDKEEEEAVFKLSAGGFAIHNGTSFVLLEDESLIAQYTTVEYSKGMAILWSVGSAIHAVFDNTIWYVTSCGCLANQEKKFACMNKHKGLINVIVALGFILITAVATLAVVIRATVEGGGELAGSLSELRATGLDGEKVSNKSNYEFMMSYSIELLLAWFIWFPIVETILFSGILSCGGRVPFMGGRPQEIKEAKKRQQTNLSKSKKRRSLSRAEEGRAKPPKSPKKSSSVSSTPKKSPTKKGKKTGTPTKKKKSSTIV